MTGKKVSKKMLLLLSFVVLVVTAAVAAAVPNNQLIGNSEIAIRTYLQPDLTLKSVLSPALLPEASGLTVAGGGLRTCRCSCGFRCTTNADCGPGGVCAPGITCCEKKQGDPELQSFQASAAASSRTGEAPAFNVKCK
jgi:hypothetical protein